MKKRNTPIPDNEINTFDNINICDDYPSIHTILPIHNPHIKKKINTKIENNCCFPDMICFCVACTFILFIFIFPTWIIITSTSIYLTDYKINHDIDNCLSNHVNCNINILQNCSDYLDLYKSPKSNDRSNENLNKIMSDLKMCYLKNGNIIWTSFFDSIILFILIIISIVAIVLLYMVFTSIKAHGFNFYKIIYRHKENN